MIKKILVTSVLIINLWLCASCGFHPRSAENLPQALDVIALQMPNIDSNFQKDIAHLFHSLQVKIDSNAPIKLDISEFNFSRVLPELTTTTQAVTYTYHMTLTFSIIKNNKIVVPSKTLYASRSIIMNVNQVYTRSTVSLAKHEMEKEMINSLYFQLISQNTQHALQNKTT